MYVPRTLAAGVLKVNTWFRVLFLGGPRQVGKLTLLQRNIVPGRTVVSLGNLGVRQLAVEDPAAFLAKYPPPVLIDEVQYAPNLFSYIKYAVDHSAEKGLYWLTGSQQFHLMKNVTESLAGRVGILKLQGLSQREKFGRPEGKPFLALLKGGILQISEAKITPSGQAFNLLWQGGYPEIFTGEAPERFLFYENYLQDYVRHDVRAFLQIKDELRFLTFMAVLAAGTGQILDYTYLAREVGISVPTVRDWLSVLHATGMIYFLPPYFRNPANTMIKTPKVYFLDTGLVCHLTRILSAEQAAVNMMSGALLETYVLAEILKSYWHNAETPAIYFYRDKQKREIDFLLEENGCLHPIEVKQKHNPHPKDIKNFEVIEKVLGMPRGVGAVVCLAEEVLPLNREVTIFPVGCL